ncbi:DEAD/DEAH box helicase [Azotobacter chroococcum]|nr:DEAD/DEAH box helicase [Azotobacter chroococcum]
MTFASLGLIEPLLRTLPVLGYILPTPVQRQAIPALLAGRDLLVAAQTGSGKTAGFALPVLQRLTLEGPPVAANSVRALVLVPTRELAEQVHGSIRACGMELPLRTAVAYGGVSINPQMMMLRPGLDVLVATPGRLLDLYRQNAVRFDRLQILVLDEADRMLDMGFAEDMQRLVEECANRRQTLLFSATTGGSGLREMVAKVLREPQHLMLNAVSDLSETIRQQIVTADDPAHKEQLVHWLLEHESYCKAIVFTNTRVQADRLYGHLVAAGQKAFVLHGEKDQKERKLAIERLKQGGTKVLVATDVAARGLDVEGLDLVINFDMPRSGDEYLHRVGRTGRAGAEGLAVSLICHNDWNLMSSIERYLKQHFERRVIKELKGSYQGPKNLKASGKAAGTKKKKPDDKKGGKKPATKAAPRRKPAGPSLVSQDGLAPLRRRTPPAE